MYDSWLWEELHSEKCVDGPHPYSHWREAPSMPAHWLWKASFRCIINSRDFGDVELILLSLRV